MLESNLNYAFMRSGNLRNDASKSEISEFAERWVDSYIEHGGHKSFLEFGIGTWEENARSWLGGGKRFPHLLVRYDQLRTDTHAELGRVCRFLEIERNAEQIENAASAASRESMRAIEEREIAARIPGFFFQRRNQPGYEAGHRFVGRSRSGEAIFALTDQQNDRARARFAQAMAEFGYAE